jgi:hypothetical protein
MSDSDLTTVFSFHLYEGYAEKPEVAAYQATPDHIARLGGTIIEGSQRQVAVDELDELGRYRRIATGWGALS